MDIPPAYIPTTNDQPAFPVTRFAAVEHVEFALTNESHPIASFKRGGVMLSELAPGEFAIIVIGGSYNITVDNVVMSPFLDIVTDNVNTGVMFSAIIRTGHEVKSWTHLRFRERTVYSRFMRLLWAAFDEVTSKHALLHDRLFHVAYNRPSNFTRYCRQYLGEDYFDNLVDDSDSDDSDEEENHTMVGYGDVGSVEMIASGGGRDSPANDALQEDESHEVDDLATAVNGGES